MRVLLQHGPSAQASAFRPSDKGTAEHAASGLIEKDPFHEPSTIATFPTGLLRTTLLDLGRIADETGTSIATTTGLLRLSLLDLGRIADETATATASASGSMSYTLLDLAQAGNETATAIATIKGTLS